MHYTPGTFTHLPISTPSPSNIDLSDTRGVALSQGSGWEVDNGGGGDSDHSVVIITLNILPPPFRPTPQHHLNNWPEFVRTLNAYDNNTRNWENANTTAAAAECLTTLLQTAADLHVPWAKPRTHSKRWWTPALTGLKNRLADTQRELRATPPPPTTSGP